VEINTRPAYIGIQTRSRAKRNLACTQGAEVARIDPRDRYSR
jgi:hypothetical protein